MLDEHGHEWTPFRLVAPFALIAAEYRVDGSAVVWRLRPDEETIPLNKTAPDVDCTTPGA